MINMEQLLKVENLSVAYNDGDRAIKAVRNVSFTLNKGDTLGIVGESGSGKTSIAMSLMGLLDSSAEISGKIIYEGVDLQQLKDKEKNKYRWKRIALVFQNTIEVLNPVLSINEQIIEIINKHTELEGIDAENKVIELLNMVGLDPTWNHHFPHQLSGGMRQRVLIAMALACDPEILIVDEPTTALDALSRNSIIKLLKKLQQEKKFVMIVISHELSVISKLTSKIQVMYYGDIVEAGSTEEILRRPAHTYTRGLINSSIEINSYQDLWGIPAKSSKIIEKGCPFYFRCNQHIDICKHKRPELEQISTNRKVACNRGGIVTLLEGKNISKKYIMHGKGMEACKNCSISIRSGEVVALIGQSGSGKTTLASILSGILDGDEGKVFFEGEEVRENSATAKMNGVQMVFQDPFSATDSFMNVEQVIREPLDILKLGTKEERKEQVKEALRQVQLDTLDEFLKRKCHALSGGQRQRVAIARSLIMKPKLLIADEVSSMLDPSTKANILRLLKGLQNSNGFAMLYITHDLSLARKIADEVYVMYNGEIIEKGSVVNVFNNPKKDYTKELIREGLNY